MSDGRDISELASATLAGLRARGWMVVTAESCTGGMIAAALTSIAGSSDVVDRGFVTYSNAAKTDMLGVPAAVIEMHGAVSAEVAAVMAQGALERSRAGIAVSVTGIAGPGGGSAEKPVGLVWFGCAVKGAPPQTTSRIFSGDRTAIRQAATEMGLSLVMQSAVRSS